jgi:Protoglobin
VHHIDVKHITGDAVARIAFLEKFIGFTDDDWAALSDSVPILSPKLPALLDAIYDHLLSFDDTRRLFLGPRGEVDPAYIAVRKEHLTDWLLRTVGGGDRGAFAEWLMTIGKRHTGVAGEPERVVPPRYMVALTSFVQTAIWDALFAESTDATLVRRCGQAWSKMMIIQLEIFLKVIAPHWPRWDEA